MGVLMVKPSRDNLDALTDCYTLCVRGQAAGLSLSAILAWTARKRAAHESQVHFSMSKSDFAPITVAI